MNIKKKLVVPSVMALGMIVGASPSFAYTVQPGDTLGKIADSHSLALDEIIKINPNISDPNRIYPGNNVNTVSNTVTSTNTNVSTNHNINVSNNTGYNNNVNAGSYETNLIARLVQAESGSESFTGKVAVASVILNRVKSSQFPNTVQGVVYQAGQFVPAASGSINNTPSNDSVRAVQQAMNGDITGGALYFYNPSTANSRWLDSLQTTVIIGNHTFKK